MKELVDCGPNISMSTSRSIYIPKYMRKYVMQTASLNLQLPVFIDD